MAIWTRWFSSHFTAAEIAAPEAGIEGLRRQVLSLLEDCSGVECDRLRWRVRTANNAHDLWMLRGAVFQLVARQHCESLAAQRIEALAPAFRQILPRTMLARARAAA